MALVSAAAVEMIREAVATIERGDAKVQTVASAIATVEVRMIGFWRPRIVAVITPTTQLGWARIESADFGHTKIADLIVTCLNELGRRAGS